MVADDFSVDFDRSGPIATLLNEIVSELGLVVCDLPYRDDIKFAYERDNGLVHYWVDHVLCSQSLTSYVTHIHSLMETEDMV